MHDTCTTTIPLLTTPRLRLREPRREDFELFAREATDAEARRHLGGVLDRRDAWRHFLNAAGGWLILGMGWWTVEVPGVGPVGTVGVFQRESRPDVEMGWIIYRAHAGRGYGTEAARAALACAVERWGVTRVIAFISAENAPSLALAERIGMRTEGDADFYGEMLRLYAYAP